LLLSAPEPSPTLSTISVAAMSTTETTITPHESTKLTVVYTTETWNVNKTLAMFERWVDEDKKGNQQFVGLDLEYTPSGRDQTVIVVQLAMRDHVLVYHHCRGSKYCPELREFLQNKQITFASMDMICLKRIYNF
jgi:hypothetical protein